MEHVGGGSTGGPIMTEGRGRGGSIRQGVKGGRWMTIGNRATSRWTDNPGVEQSGWDGTGAGCRVGVVGSRCLVGSTRNPGSRRRIGFQIM